MPVVRGLEVRIQTKNGVLPEYGTMRLGSGSIFSTFIQSEDKTPFQISFKPSNTFNFSRPPDKKLDQKTASMKPTIWKSHDSRYWDLNAYIFIDNNTESDKNIIINLPRHGKPCQAVMAHGRSCVSINGSSAEQEWSFNEIPMENQFAKLTTNEKIEDEWEDMNSDSGAGDGTKTGQIKIQLFRIHQRGIDKTRKLEERLPIPQGQSQMDGDNEISHTIGVGEPKPKTFNYITVDNLDGPEDPWATVIFMYRGKRQLQKMGLIPENDPMSSENTSTFKPGPSTHFNPTQINFNGYGNGLNGLKLYPKEQGTSSSNISATYPSPGVNNPPRANTSKKLELSPPIHRDSTIKGTSFLKRKSKHEVEISTSLSAMSLNKKGSLTLKNPADYIGPRNKSMSESNGDDEVIELKRVKIKRTDPSGEVIWLSKSL